MAKYLVIARHGSYDLNDAGKLTPQGEHQMRRLKKQLRLLISPREEARPKFFCLASADLPGIKSVFAIRYGGQILLDDDLFAHTTLPADQLERIARLINEHASRFDVLVVVTHAIITKALPPYLARMFGFHCGLPDAPLGYGQAVVFDEDKRTVSRLKS